ncbi:unnamed protein product [Peronospora belbahrii]|uniref:Uncharacterized protein n=1 Tax=Peronospora belbahrii TaxID=622444 RepID=A0AAU9L899_9STRA|nr:unnamed protein product [Peronospora belbahrii]CAH0516168.1 unnamed protein product [Peronospora belbahrii]
MAGIAGYTEAQLVVLGLSVVVVAVALLSYFVVAPEYQKHLEKQYAALAHASSKRQLDDQQALLARMQLRKHKSLGAWDIESGSSDDDGRHRCSLQRRHSHMRPAPASISSPRDMVTMAAQLARKERNARRRKSESDALKQATVQRADMLRRRVLLRKLEEEIAGTVKANKEAQAAATSNSRMANTASYTLDLSNDRLKMLQEHPADCVKEFTILARAQSLTVTLPIVDNAAMAKSITETAPEPHEVKQALKHDGLNRLRAFEASRDKDVRALSISIIEKAVPAIWH